jgi:hypothetical protein
MAVETVAGNGSSGCPQDDPLSATVWRAIAVTTVADDRS